MKHSKISLLASLFFTTHFDVLFGQDTSWKDNYPVMGIGYLHNPDRQSDILEQWNKIKFISGNRTISLSWSGNESSNSGGQLLTFNGPPSSDGSFGNNVGAQSGPLSVSDNSNDTITAQQALRMYQAGQLTVPNKRALAILKQMAEVEKQVIEQAVKIEQEKQQAEHLEKHGVTHEFLWEKGTGLYHERDFEKVKKQILKIRGITRAQALNIWDGYCHKRKVCGDKKIEYHCDINNEYAHREAVERIERKKIKDAADKKQKEEQEELEQQRTIKLQQETEKREQEQKQQFQQVVECQQVIDQPQLSIKPNEESVRFVSQTEIIQQRMQQLGLDPQQCMYLPQDYQQLEVQYYSCAQLCQQQMLHDETSIWNKRLHATQQSIEQNFAQEFQSISLSPQAQGYLMACDLIPQQYTTCYGTALQHQLHAEICHSFELIAQKQYQQYSKSIFFDAAVQCSNASFMSNEFEAVNWAVALQDVSRACCNVGSWIFDHSLPYVQAVVNGVVQSAQEFVHMALNPKKLCSDLGTALLFAVDTIALYDWDMSEHEWQATQSFRDQRQALLTAIVDTILDEMDKFSFSGPDSLQLSTKLVCDCFFQEKTFQALGALAGIIRSQAKVARGINFAADVMAHEPAFALAGEHMVQATSELEQVAQNTLKQEMVSLNAGLQQSGGGAAKSLLHVRCINELKQEIQKLGGVISLANIQLCDEVKQTVTKIIQETNCLIEQKFLKEFSCKWFGNYKVNMDIKHIAQYSCEFVENFAENKLEMIIQGGHLAGGCAALEKAGLVKIIETNPLGNGCFAYEMEILLTGETLTKSEFPTHWDYKKVIQSCWEAYESPSTIEKSVKGNKIARQGVIDNVDITLILKKYEKCCNVITAYVME